MSESLLKDAVGFVAGGAWNVASLWSLQRMLRAWLSPARSRRRALLWLLVKFPLLYVLGLAMLHRQQVSPLGFGIGFTLVLIIGVGIALRASAPQRLHGR